MIQPIYTIRPQPGFAATIAAGRKLGLEVGGEPLFSIETREWTPPPPGEYDALLLGSANAVRHGGSALGSCAGKPVYAVGTATADAAREAGFRVSAIGSGGLQRIVDGLAGTKLRLLRLAGAEHVLIEPPRGITLHTRVVYASRPLPLSESFSRSLREGGIVLVHSANAAKHLSGECDRLGIARPGLGLAVLGRRIAQAAGQGWGWVEAAAEPTESALLVLARDMCQ